MQSQNRETYNPCKLYKEIVYGGIYSRGGFSQVWWNSYLIFRKTRLQMKLAREQQERMEKEKKGNIEKMKTQRRRQFLPH